MISANNTKRNKMSWLLNIVVLGLLISIANIASAQATLSNVKVEANAKIDTSAIMIGEQTAIHLQLIIPKELNVQWPLYLDTLTKSIEIIKSSEIDTITNDNEGFITLNQEIIISSFDSGLYTIPPFYFYYGMPNDIAPNIVKSNALSIEVKNVEVDLEKEIKDIKPIIEEPWTFKEILPYILIALAILLIIALAIYVYQRRKNNKPIFSLPQKPKLPAHIIALKKLNELKDKKLWQTGSSKEFYTELTDILREYMEGNMHFDALEMVSDDILSELNSNNLDEALLKDTRIILQTADLVKFAKVEPLADENDRALKWGYYFVESTKPIEEKPESNSNSETEVEPSKGLSQ